VGANEEHLLTFKPVSIVEAVVATDQSIALCPLCASPDGRPLGVIDSMDNMRAGKLMPVCRLCKGRRCVYLNKVCTCGSSAVLYNDKEKIWFCGREVCLNILKHRMSGEWQGC
jgi:hypothetical protein